MLNHIFSLIFGALMMGSMVAYLLYRFGRFNRSHSVAYFLIFLSWFLTFYTKFLIPIDVVSTTYRQCLKNNVSSFSETSNVTCSKPWNYVEPEAFKMLWRFIYWTMQFLSIIALPVVQAYCLSGHFTFGGKMKDALCRNAIYYGTLFGLCLFFLFYLFMNPSYGGLSFENIKTIASSASNTWGMINLVVLMGYGLVDIPRNLWFKSNNTKMYKKIVFSLSKFYDEKEAALDRLHFFVEKLKEMGPQLLSNNNRNRYDQIVVKLPLNFQNFETEKERVRAHAVIYQNGGDTDFLTAFYTSFICCCCKPKSDEYYQNADAATRERKQQYDLVYLHYDIMRSIEEVDRTLSVFQTSLQNAIHLDDIKNSVSTGLGRFESSFNSRISPIFRNAWPSIAYLWYVYVKPALTIFLCGVTSLASVVIFWCELTFSATKPTLSLFAIAVHRLKDSSSNGWAFEIFCFGALVYMAFCTHTTVFKIKFFHFCHFVDDHQTSLRTFFFSATLLARLTIALSLNFLAMSHLDAGQLIKFDESLYTSFVSIMGKLQLFPLLRDYFNVYYPLVIGLVFLMTLFGLGSKILACLGAQTFAEDDEFMESTLSDGQNIMRRERQRCIDAVLAARQRSRRSGEDSNPLLSDMEISIFSQESLNDHDTERSTSTLYTSYSELTTSNSRNPVSLRNRF